jgi:large subunit ribosomal protein L5
VSTPAAAPPARLKIRYLEEIRPALVGRFGYSSVMQAPRLEKITLNMGVGLAKQDSKVLKAARDQLATIAGQQPSVRRARQSIAAFKLREGNPVGVAVTLRSERCYEFLDRLVSVAIPRIRDFRGLNPRSFDGRGNYSLGVREQIIFPEVDYDAIDEVRGLDITITTTAATDPEAFALLAALGMPFAAQGRPRGFDVDGPEAPEDSAEHPDAPAAVKHTTSTEQKGDVPAEQAGDVELAEVTVEEATEVAAEEAREVAVEEVAEVAIDEVVVAEVELKEQKGGSKGEQNEAGATERNDARTTEQGEASANGDTTGKESAD